MTINQLIKALQKIEAKHGKRIPVCMSIRAHKSLMDDYSHWRIGEVYTESILWAKDDSFERQDGSERWKTVVTIL